MIQRIAVVGAGTMGAGIAQLCAQNGFSVKIYDAFPAALETLPARLKSALDAAVLKGKMTTTQAERAYHSISPTDKLDELAGADLVLEAASEELSLKRELFAALDKICPEAILATNTSSLSVASIAEAVSTPHRVLGFHFFNPPVAMKLVELVRAPKTSPEVFQAVWEFALAGLRKTPVDCKDTPGFIVNRVMRPYYLEGQRAARGGSGIAALDAAARAAGVPMGPFELMDLIGLDVNLAITRSIYEACGRPERFAPQPVQETLVAGGQLGRKTSVGFYLYEAGKPVGENPAALAQLPKGGTMTPHAGWERVIDAVIAEARLAADEGVAGPHDIDTAIKLAMNFPKGPFQWRAESPAPSKS
jgi:3-hydroxybutyryl-CoA dehydrogenase